MHASKQDNASHKSDRSQTTLMEAVCFVTSMVQQQTVVFMQFAEATLRQTTVMIEKFSRQALTPVSQPSSIGQIDVLRDIVERLADNSCRQTDLLQQHFNRQTRHFNSLTDELRREVSDVRRRIEQMATTVNSSICKINNAQTSLLANGHIVNAITRPTMSPMVQPLTISAPVASFTKVVLPVVTSAAYATSTYAVEEMLSLKSTISNAANTVSSNTMLIVTFNNSTVVVSSTQQTVSSVFVPASVLNSFLSTKCKERKVSDYGGESGVHNYLMQFQMVAKYNGVSEEKCAVN